MVNEAGCLTGYNTDYIAVRLLLEKHEVDPQTPFLLRGSGGMAKAVVAGPARCGLRGWYGRRP